MTRLLLLATTLIGLAPATAFAWDFTCSPREATTIPFQSPNVLIMLDRSGSMDDADGEVPNSCKVCEIDGTYFEVASASECVGGTPWTFTDANTYPANSVGSGYTHSFVFDNVPPANQDIRLDITIRADLNGACEWGDVFVDGDELFELRDVGDCVDGTLTFSVPASYAADGQIAVDLVMAPDNNACDGRPAACAPTMTCDGVGDYCAAGNFAEVTITHNPAVYHGSQSWEDPCGISNKWEQALRAIDRLTLDGQSATPEAAYFGLGLFHQSIATVHEECEPSNHDDIMSVLYGTAPGGLTPMARAIRAALQSDCVSGTSYNSVIEEEFVPRDPANSGYDLDVWLDDIYTNSDIELEVTLWGDYGSACEFAQVSIDGIAFGPMTDDRDCRPSGISRTFTVPPTFVTDHRLNVTLDNRADGEATSSPPCGTGEDGVDAQCPLNGVRVVARWPNELAPATATILVTDGLPTMDINGNSGNDTTNYLHPIQQACAHRGLAPMFVVGLGAATDEDYNNILAAAAGTGVCIDAVGARRDPCDDMANWEDLRTQCSGSFQASSGDSLLTALAEITAALSCTFKINFFNSGVDSVPTDPTNEYPYLAVDAYDYGAGQYVRIPHQDDPAATPAGEGWTFATEARINARFSDYYCDLVQNYQYSEVGTHLACLCQEQLGDRCAVPDWEDRNVCPTGQWACTEGTDWCEPDADCCIPGVPCIVEGLLGECAKGEIVCDSLFGSCRQTIFPTDEICDGLDNDCDGVIDEITGDCTVPDATGRCAVGAIVCEDAVERCIPLNAELPELCNGLDDDCDGLVDNLFESWGRAEFQTYKSNATAEQRACGYLDVCTCPDGATDDHAGVGFEDYVANWDPVCECGEGLAPGVEPAHAEPGPDTRGAPASCATSGGREMFSGWALLVGLLLLRRRRDRR